MELLSRKRLPKGILVLLLGLLLAGASAVLLWRLFLRVNPRTLSLAYRLDPARVQLFLRTQDRATLQRAVWLSAPLVSPAPPPAAASLPPALSFEYAVLRRQKGSGAIWVVYAHQEGGRHLTILSENDPSAFLPPKEIRRSLAREPFFGQRVEEATKNLLWADLQSFPLPPGPAASLLKASMAPYRRALILWDSQAYGELLLEKQEDRNEQRMAGIPPALLPPVSPVLEIRSASLPRTWNLLSEALGKWDTPLAEGLTGILRATMQEYTRSTDLQAIGEDMFSSPSTIAVVRGSGGQLSLVVTGTATSEEAIGRWTLSIASALTPGIVRFQRFFNENVRTDVIAPTEGGLAQESPVQGWKIMRMGASGSTSTFTVARHNRVFAFANDHRLLLQIIATAGSNDRGRSTTGVGGTVDLLWFFSWLDRSLPFLAKDARLLAFTLLGPETLRLTWQSTDGNSTVRIRWSLLRTQLLPLALPAPAGNAGKK
ncbi:MAG: hypothetical protein WC840_04370 [Candidatus Peribacteraceae bacterium]